eukprot:1370881-Amphidinium_carterae.1
MSTKPHAGKGAWQPCIDGLKQDHQQQDNVRASLQPIDLCCVVASNALGRNRSAVTLVLGTFSFVLKFLELQTR